MPRLPDKTRADVVSAIETYRKEYASDYAGWQKKAGYKFALIYQGHKYPCKEIISIATGLDKRMFSGGAESNRWLKKRGFEIAEFKTAKKVSK